MKRIVIVSDHANVRCEPARAAVESAIGLARAGYAVTLFAAYGPIDERLMGGTVDVVCLDSGGPKAAAARADSPALPSLGPVWNGAAAKRLRTLLSGMAVGETVVHVHGWSQALSASIFPVISASGLHVVHSAHDFSLVCPNDDYVQHQKHRVCTLKPMSLACMASNCDAGGYGRKLHRVARQFMASRKGKLPGGARHVIYKSDAQRDVLSRLMPGSSTWYALRDPVTVPKADPVDVAKNKIFMFVGQLAAGEGAMRFARAAKQVGLAPVFVGNGPQRDSVQAACPSARMITQPGAGGLDGLLKKARAIVLPGGGQGAVPRAVYEAIARGIPVVVSSRGAAVQVVEDGAHGLVFDPRAPGSFEAVLERLWKEDDTVNALGVKAYERFWFDAPTPEHHVRELVKIYANVLGTTLPEPDFGTPSVSESAPADGPDQAGSDGAAARPRPAGQAAAA